MKIMRVSLFMLLMLFNMAIAQEIFDAVQNANLDKVKELISGNPGLVNSKNENDFTPLHFAVTIDNVEIVKYLLKNGASIDEKSKNGGHTPLMRLAYASGNVQIAKLLVEHRSDINIMDDQNISVFRRAVSLGKKDFVEFLMEKGVIIPPVTETARKNIFRNSVRRGLVKLFDKMLAEGADVFETDETDANLLHYASRGGFVEIIDRLIKASIKSNSADKFGHWGREINISEIIGANGFCPYVSNDGRYLFFFNKDNMYWADASFIEEIRKEELKNY